MNCSVVLRNSVVMQFRYKSLTLSKGELKRNKIKLKKQGNLLLSMSYMFWFLLSSKQCLNFLFIAKKRYVARKFLIQNRVSKFQLKLFSSARDSSTIITRMLVNVRSHIMFQLDFIYILTKLSTK